MWVWVRVRVRVWVRVVGEDTDDGVKREEKGRW